MNPEIPSSAVIVGLGRTGLSCARYLAARGWRLAVTDTRSTPPEHARLEQLYPSIPVRSGGLDPQLLEGARYVVTSPGVSLEHPFFAQARARDIEIVGDIEVFARTPAAAAASLAGITGTNGKSTVTTLVAGMAARAGKRVRVGGNLGEPALDLLEPPPGSLPGPAELYVLELSSFQLETTRSLALQAAALLNVTADHLDRHASLASYAQVKARIFAGCETAVINLDDPLVVGLLESGQRRLTFSLRPDSCADYRLAEGWLTRCGEPLLAARELKIHGMHNVANALASLAMGEALGLPLPAMLAELADFAGLPHRAQWVAQIAGVTYINDSKGTNVGATIAAVTGLAGPLVVIAGGDGKQQDFAPLAAAFHGKVRHALLIGRDAPALAAALEGVCELTRCSGLEEAVHAAARLARAGDTVLLSPACASLDMFRDYTERGAVFTRAVQELAA